MTASNRPLHRQTTKRLQRLINKLSNGLGLNAIRLKTPEAGHGFADMKPLKKIMGNARIVSLGEATHGTREFFQLKHWMLEFLASEMGFTIFPSKLTCRKPIV